jgi:hypothetical protein
MNIEFVHKVELGELTRYIAHAKGITYAEAERIIPEYVYEGCFLAQEGYNSEGEWCQEVRELLKKLHIDRVEVYQDD